MTQNWAEPARLMVERLVLDAGADGLSRLWSLAKAAQRATLRLALDPCADPDLSMTHAAMDLGELLEEIEWADPAVAAVRCRSTWVIRRATRSSAGKSSPRCWSAHSR